MTAPVFYRVRLTKGGPAIGLKVWHSCPTDPITGELLTERPAIWRAQRSGVDMDIRDATIEMDGITGRPVVRGEIITEDEYLHLSSVAKWAKQHAPDDPYAKPNEKVDLNKLPPIKF